MSNPSNADPENVHEEDLIDLQADEEAKENTVFGGEWNRNNFPPHNNEERFNYKNAL